MTELTTENKVSPQLRDGKLLDVGSLMAVLHQIQDPRALLARELTDLTDIGKTRR